MEEGRDGRRGEERDGRVGGWHFLLGYHCLAGHPHSSSGLSSDGVWDILSPNTAPQHGGYLLKLKAFEKTEAGKSLRPLLPGFLSLSQSDDPQVLSCDRCPPYLRRQGASLSPKTKGAKKNPSKQDLLHFPFTTCTLTCHFPPHDCPSLLQTRHKSSQA